MTSTSSTATSHLLDYLAEQVQRLGDDYTAVLLGNVAEAHNTGSLRPPPP